MLDLLPERHKTSGEVEVLEGRSYVLDAAPTGCDARDGSRRGGRQRGEIVLTHFPSLSVVHICWPPSRARNKKK